MRAPRSITHHAPTDTPGPCKGPAAKGWKLASEQPAMCEAGHDVSGKTAPHGAIKALGCTGCHDPHASANPTLLKAWPVAKLCADCHDIADGLTAVHTPVARGECVGCHNPHAGEEPPLLKVPRAGGRCRSRC